MSKLFFFTQVSEQTIYYPLFSEQSFFFIKKLSPSPEIKWSVPQAAGDCFFNCLLKDFLFSVKIDVQKIYSISTMAKKRKSSKDSYKQSSAACGQSLTRLVVFGSS